MRNLMISFYKTVNIYFLKFSSWVEVTIEVVQQEDLEAIQNKLIKIILSGKLFTIRDCYLISNSAVLSLASYRE